MRGVEFGVNASGGELSSIMLLRSSRAAALSFVRQKRTREGAWRHAAVPRKVGGAAGCSAATRRFNSSGAFNRAVDKISPDTSNLSSSGLVETLKPLFPYIGVAGGIVLVVGTYKYVADSKPTALAADAAISAAQMSPEIQARLGGQVGDKTAMAGFVRTDEKRKREFDHEAVGFPGPLPAKTSFFEVRCACRFATQSRFIDETVHSSTDALLFRYLFCWLLLRMLRERRPRRQATARKRATKRPWWARI